MEAAALTASILGLAALFNNAVECFEYVRFGRSFGKDFQTHLLKLDDARLRLSRWGESVGLSGELLEHDMAALPHTLKNNQAVQDAKERLEQICRLFTEAEGVSNGLKAPSATTDIAVHNEDEMDPTVAGLHEEMHRLVIGRQNRTAKTSLRQKVQWALYEKKHFTALIEDVNKLVSGLTELFPAAKSKQQALCKNEVGAISGHSLAVLKDAIGGQDKYLEAAIESAIEGAQKLSSGVSFGSHNAGLQMLDNKGSMSGFTFGRSQT